MSNWWTGKGYGISDIKDFNGRPFLTYQGPNDKIPVTLYDRVAQTFDFTVAQQLTAGSFKNDRFDSSTSSAIKKILGGGTNDELDHKISLELGGSNSPANLFIQAGITSGASAASDTLENNLALDVANGKISLETAWETLSEQKGFLLGEDMLFKSTLDKNTFLDIAKTVSVAVFTGPGSLLNPFSILGFDILSLFQSKKQTVTIKAVNTVLKSQLDADILQLKTTPLNQQLLTKVFKEQVQLTAQQLQISDREAGKTVSSYLASYAQNKGIDAKGMMAAMNADIQKIISASQEDPNIMGVSSATIVKIIAALQTVNTVAIPVSITIIIIGIFMAGPEAILGALSGGLLESIGAIFGVSATTGIGLTAFAVAEALNVAAMGLNQSIKSTYDNKYLLPTQQISALKDALAIQKGLAGFLPSESNTSNATTDKKTGSGGGSGTTTATAKVYTGIVSQGVVGAGLVFTPRPDDMIESIEELKAAASNNLAPFLQTLPGKIVYEVKIVSSIVTKDGFKQTGTSQKIQTGTFANGTPKYKNVTNKFATLVVYALTDKGSRAKLTTIVLGPTDSAKLTVAQNDLQALQDALPALVTTTDINEITNIKNTTDKFNTTTGQPNPDYIHPTQAPAPTPTPAQAPSGAFVTIYKGTESKNIVNSQDNLQYYLNDGWSTTAVSAPATVNNATSAAPSATKAGANASTLYEWYQAQGQSLPSISVRSQKYASLGLGQASYYTGTSEQNTKLLAALKQQ